jgi:hypothetical protein
MHNLDIHSYSLYDLLSLFKIQDKSRISNEDIKNAKKIVLLSHPDKSKLPSEYFLFYKKAFELLLDFYEKQNKTNQHVPKILKKEDEMKYENIPKEINEKELSKHISKLSADKNFHQTFNQLFEENMREMPDSSKNEWFRKEEPLFHTNIQNIGQMNAELEKIKEKTQSMSIYRGITTLNSGTNGSNLYGDDINDEYITSDPFSKLKYEDLRKVHKDQTVFQVSEKDMSKIKTYTSVDQYKNTRETQYIPMEKEKAQGIIEEQEKEMRNRIFQKQHMDNLKTLENIEKNKNIQATFLRLNR